MASDPPNAGGGAEPGADGDDPSAALLFGGTTAEPELLELLDVLVDVIFCAKDLDGRYVAVNGAFVRRTGRRSKRDVLGRRAGDVFPAVLADRYEEQDAEVLGTGRHLRDEIELIRRADGSLGWYLTTKVPVADRGVVVGLVSVSRDLGVPSDDAIALESLERVVAVVQERLAETIRVPELAEVAGTSVATLERRMKAVFGISPSQYLLKARVDRAADLLAGTEVPLAEVATRCGFYDQADLTRRFARLTGETPAQFRTTHAGR